MPETFSFMEFANVTAESALMSATIISLTFSKCMLVETANLPMPPLPPKAKIFIVKGIYVGMISKILIEGASSHNEDTTSSVPSSVLN